MRTTGWVPLRGVHVKSLVPGTLVPGFLFANSIAELQLDMFGPSAFEGTPSGLWGAATPPGWSGVMSDGGAAKAMLAVPMSVTEVVTARRAARSLFIMDLLRVNLRYP